MRKGATLCNMVSNSGMIPEWTLGDRLRKARQIAGLSQRQIAAAIGERASTYAMWEADSAFPRDLETRVERISAVTGVSALWLLGSHVDGARPMGTDGHLDTTKLYVLLGEALGVPA
jgi:transcriptional regulator with XRE-family HTH domain